MMREMPLKKSIEMSVKALISIEERRHKLPVY